VVGTPEAPPPAFGLPKRYDSCHWLTVPRHNELAASRELLLGFGRRPGGSGRTWFALDGISVENGIVAICSLLPRVFMPASSRSRTRKPPSGDFFVARPFVVRSVLTEVGSQARDWKNGQVSIGLDRQPGAARSLTRGLLFEVHVRWAQESRVGSGLDERLCRRSG
jgi:hypothetical protein